MNTMSNPNSPTNPKLDNLIKEFLQTTRPVEINLQFEEKQQLIDLLEHIQAKQKEIENQHEQLMTQINHTFVACKQQINTLQENSKQLLSNYNNINQQFNQNNQTISNNIQKFGKIHQDMQNLTQYNHNQSDTHKINTIFTMVNTFILLILFIFVIILLWKQPTTATPTQPTVEPTTVASSPANTDNISVSEPIYKFDVIENQQLIPLLKDINMNNVETKLKNKDIKKILNSDEFKLFYEYKCSNTNPNTVICLDKHKELLQQEFLLDYAKKNNPQ